MRCLIVDGSTEDEAPFGAAEIAKTRAEGPHDSAPVDAVIGAPLHSPSAVFIGPEQMEEPRPANFGERAIATIIDTLICVALVFDLRWIALATMFGEGE